MDNSSTSGPNRYEVGPLNNSTPQERHTMITIAKQMPLEPDTYWFVTSRKWFQSWEVAVLGTPSKDFPDITEQNLGPVDNSDILQSGTSDLLPDLVEGYEIEFIPEDAWNNFSKWYGQPSTTIKREVIAWPTRSGLPELRIEVYPRTFYAFLLVDSDRPSISSTSFEFPANGTLSSLASRAASSLGISGSQRFRVWNMPPRTPKSGIPLRNIYQGSLLPIPVESDTPVTELNRLSTVIAVEIYSGDSWLVDADAVSIPADPCATVHLRSNPEKSPKVIPFKGRRYQSHVPRGTMGLQNLGHTCFMNAGLQCLLHIPELERYFLNNLYQNELNLDNPLGTQGEFARAFGTLVKQTYPEGARPKSIVSLDAAGSDLYSAYVPLNLKGIVCQWAPQFAGYEECDSQELIGTILDGLHEDLNRVLKKPYVEKPEWPENVSAADVAKVEARIARETWEGHGRRNNSIVADLFQGMYKSTLTCPDCGKVSVTFDPFMSLALPLPAADSQWRSAVQYVPWDVAQPKVTIQVELSKDQSIENLKKQMASKFKSKHENLLVVEVWNHKIFKFLENQTNVTDLAGNETLVVYELSVAAVIPQVEYPILAAPTSYPLIIPVFHTSAGLGFGLPFFVALNASEAKSYQSLRDLVESRLGQWASSSAEIQGELSRGDVFELQIFGSDSSTIETGFRLGQPNTEFIDWESRERTGAPLVQVNEALVCVWQPALRDRVFPNLQPNVDNWGAAKAELIKSRVESNDTPDISLSDCIDELTKAEQLSVNDSWYCSKCQQHRQATKQLQLWNLPNILVLQLKRFAKRSKIDKLVTFPIHGLDLSERVGDKASGSNNIYDLFAVDEHWGAKTSSGHYTAYAKNESDGAWYHYKDSVVSPTTPETTVNRGAYLLFYRRRSASPEEVLSKMK